MASSRLFSKSAMKRLVSGLQSRSPSGELSQRPFQVQSSGHLHGIAPATPCVRETVGMHKAPKSSYVPKRDMHFEHSFKELATDYGFLEFEPLYRVLRAIVIISVARNVAEIVL